MKAIIGLILVVAIIALLIICNLFSRKNERDAVDDLENGEIEPIK